MTPGQTPQKAPPLTRAQIWTISALAATCAASYALTAVFRHQHFDSSVDLGIFDQAVWHLSRFEAPSSSIRGFSNLFGDHFHPIILLFAPLYWLAPAAETLLSQSEPLNVITNAAPRPTAHARRMIDRGI